MLLAVLLLFLASADILNLFASFLIFPGLILGIFGPCKKNKDAKIGWKSVGWLIFGIAVFTVAATTAFAAYLTLFWFNVAFVLFIGGFIIGTALLVSPKIQQWPWWAKLILFIL